MKALRYTVLIVLTALVLPHVFEDERDEGAHLLWPERPDAVGDHDFREHLAYPHVGFVHNVSPSFAVQAPSVSSRPS